MSLALNRENFFWHKVHSLTGVIPVGYYMVQHLVLNSFALAGPSYYNGVIGFFEGMPKFFLLTLEVCAIWIPILFHAVYGIFIASRSKFNYFESKYGWSQNFMFVSQRVTGVLIFLFLCVHVATTTLTKYVTGNADVIRYDAMSEKMHNPLWLAFYVVGVFACSYHLGYGIWNFCIRWGITISESAQIRVQKFSFVFFVAVTLIGWGALAGFFIHPKAATETAVMRSAPQSTL